MCMYSVSRISPSWSRAGCKKTLCLLYYRRKIKFIHFFIHSPPPPPSSRFSSLSLCLFLCYPPLSPPSLSALSLWNFVALTELTGLYGWYEFCLGTFLCSYTERTLSWKYVAFLDGTKIVLEVRCLSNLYEHCPGSSLPF